MYFMLITKTIWNLILLFEPNLYVSSVCVNAKSLQSCPAFCNPMDYRPPGSSVHGILQAKIL